MANKHIALTLGALVATLFLFELTSIDLHVQDWLYNQAQGHWVLARTEPVSRFVFYDGIKKLLIIGALSLLLVLLFGKRFAFMSHYRSGLSIVFFSMLLVPGVIGGLKQVTNVACPRDLQHYGGYVPYIKVFETYAEAERPSIRQECFPAAHASGGFGLMSLYFLFQRRRHRQLGLAVGLSMGWIMGGYKMLIGDHFLSHTLVSMELSWLVIILVARWGGYWTPDNARECPQ